MRKLMENFRPIGYVLILSLLFFGCVKQPTNTKKKEINSLSSTVTTIKGNGMLGVIQGAQVALYPVLSSGILDLAHQLAFTTTDADGNYTLIVPNANISSAPVGVQITGGSYIEEASGQRILLTGKKLTAIIPSVTPGSKVSAAVGPLSDMAFQVLQSRLQTSHQESLTQAAANANFQVSQAFGISDVVGTLPAKPTGTIPSGASGQYTIIIAALSNAARTAGTDSTALATAYAKHLAQNGNFSQIGNQTISVTDAGGNTVSVTPPTMAALSNISTRIGNKTLVISGLQPPANFQPPVFNTFPNAIGPTVTSNSGMCSEFTYMATELCQPSGRQAVQVVFRFPTNCTGGNPLTSQACTYVPPVIAPIGCYIALALAGSTMTTADSKTLTVNCAQGTNLSYAWKEGSTNLSTSPSLQLSGLSAGSHNYSVTVSNSNSSQTLNQVLTVDAPTISNPNATPVCYNCISIRVGRPLVVRGPFPDELDTPFPVLKLKSGAYRGFSSNGTVFSIDGSSAWSMGGERASVMQSESGGTILSWMNSVFSSGSQTIGFVHQETNFNYSIGQTFKKMSISYSSDEGLSWSSSIPIIKGMDEPTTGQIVGEGDCSAIVGKDGAYYLYCLKARPASTGGGWHTIVARAHSSDLSPTGWKKLYQGSWTEPGLGGNADNLGFIGTTPAYFRNLGQVGLFGINPYVNGITLSLSSDYKSFTTLPEVIIPFDAADWNRPASTDLYAYVGVTNYQEGGNQVDQLFGLNYIYVPPGETFEKRYLVFQDVTIQQSTSPVELASVGVELSRWQRIDDGIIRTTNAPVIENYSTFRYIKSLGYVLTKAPTRPSNKLEECVTVNTGHEDFLITNDGTCSNEGYTRLRTIGWVFKNQETGTQPLYRCYSATSQFHFASNTNNCDGLGTVEWILGYVFPASSSSYTITSPVTGIPPTPICTNITFKGGSISKSSVVLGGNFSMSCDYNQIDGLTSPSTNGAQCFFTGFAGTAAQFNCTASTAPGTYAIGCIHSANSTANTCEQKNTIGSIAVTAKVNVAPPASVCTNITFKGGSISKSSVVLGGNFSMSCDYNQIDGLTSPSTNGAQCFFTGFAGTAAQFNCTASTAPGTYAIGCIHSANSTANTCEQKNTIGSIVITPP